MANLFRPKLVCFYCNSTSTQRRKGHIRNWQCEICEAVNYLDENGQITDPPSQATPQVVRYAHKPNRSVSPTSTAQDATLFCRACIQNQLFYTEALASYLPHPSDPAYGKYEKSLETYRTGLAQRFPQVCADCAPRVNKQLRDATYMARTDHLQRMMERTKGGTIKAKTKSWHWLHLIVSIGAVMWWSSLLIQIGWHVLGLLPLAEKPMELSGETWWSYLWCIADAWETKAVCRDCFTHCTSLARAALWTGVLSFWWNSKLNQKLSSKTGRLRRVGEYAVLQIVVLGTRAVAIWVLQDADNLPSSVPIQAVHGSLLLLLTSTTITSLRTVQLQEKPLVLFSGLKPITVDESSTPRPFQPSHTHTTASFPISALAPREPTPDQGYETASATTSVDTDDRYDDSEDEMSMEWTPTQTMKTMTPRRPVQDMSSKQQPITHQTKSPFYGTLPAAPMAPAHRLLKPRQPFIPASQAKNDTFFQQMKTGSFSQSFSSNLRGTDPFDFGGSKRKNYTLQAPRLRDWAAESRETGLEGIFNSAFSIAGAEPSEEPSSGHHPDEKRETVPGFQRGHVVEGEVVRDGVLIGRLIFALFGVAIAGAVLFVWRHFAVAEMVHTGFDV